MTQCELFHKVAHQKYLMFVQCSKKVSEKCRGGRKKDAIAILSKLMEDGSWIDEVSHIVLFMLKNGNQIFCFMICSRYNYFIRSYSKVFGVYGGNWSNL